MRVFLIALWKGSCPFPCNSPFNRAVLCKKGVYMPCGGKRKKKK